MNTSKHQEYLDNIEQLEIVAHRFTKWLWISGGAWVATLLVFVGAVIMGIASVGGGTDWGGIVAAAIIGDLIPMSTLPGFIAWWLRLHLRKKTGNYSFDYEWVDWPTDKLRKERAKYNRWLANQSEV